MAIAQGHKTNFETFNRAVEDGRIALMECFNTKLEQEVVVLGMVSDADDGGYMFLPFAQLFNGNPYDELQPPNPNGGFIDTKEKRHGNHPTNSDAS